MPSSLLGARALDLAAGGLRRGARTGSASRRAGGALQVARSEPRRLPEELGRARCGRAGYGDGYRVKKPPSGLVRSKRGAADGARRGGAVGRMAAV